MKKILPLLLFALLPLWSCNLEGGYYAENARDIVTVSGDRLYSDNGAYYTVTDYGTVGKDWQADGKRLYIVFDILNKDLEIRLKSVDPMTVTEATPLDPEEVLPHDPLIVQFCRIGAGYMDISVSFFQKPATTCPHNISFRYSIDAALQKLTVTAVHDGAGEDPSKENEEDLKVETRFFSIPLKNMENVTMADLVVDVLVKDNNGKYAVQSETYHTY